VSDPVASFERPTVPAVLPLVRAYGSRPQNASGGSLHIVLEDGNVSDADIRWCRDVAAECGDADGVVLAEVLLSMSRTQRRKLARLWHVR
jgi:hypothetical protein